ncbi:hypothetical protein V6Z12_D10G122300 [Gossypium hirsutum]
MEMRIRAPNKCGLLTGSKPKPPADGKQLETWLIDNNRVKSWLIDSMSMLLMQRFICLQTAKEIWETVAKTCYDGLDERQLFQLNRRSFTSHQNGRPLSLYYNELIGIFQKIDARVQTQEDNATIIILLHKYMTQLQVHIFFADLDPEFNQAQCEILRKDPPFDLKSCYAYVWKDHNQRQTLEEPKVQSDGIAHSTACTCPSNSQQVKREKSGTKRNNYICTHYSEEGHSKQHCYEIIRYPEWWDFTKKPQKKLDKLLLLPQ